MHETPAFPARLAEPGQAFTWHDSQGVAHELVADRAGIVRPPSLEAVAIADSFGLPVAEDDEAPAAPRAKAQKAASTPTDSAPADPARED